MTPLERLKELNGKATPGPWVSIEKYSEEWGETYHGIETEDRRPIGTYDGDNAVWLMPDAAKSNRDLSVATRNLLPELLALWEVMNLQFDPDYGLHEIECVGQALDALNARAEEVMR